MNNGAFHHLNEGDVDPWKIIKYKHPPCDPIMKDVMLGPSSFVQRWWSETGKSGERLCFVWERSTTYDARWKNTWEHRVTFVHVYVRFCLFACRKLRHSTDQWSQAPPSPSQELHLSPSCLCRDSSHGNFSASCARWMITLKTCELGNDFSKSRFLIFINQLMGSFGAK